MEKFYEVVEGIQDLHTDVKKEAQNRMDSLIKPLGSLGKLETIAIQLAGITGKVKNSIQKKCMIVMAADNGVCEEGVSACPQDITTMQTINMLNGKTGISVLAKQAQADLTVVDIGVKKEIYHPNLIVRKIKYETENMSKGPAMTREEAISAIEVGIETVAELVKQGYNLIGTGEMGIGNTSTSSAILMCFTDCDVETAVGKGAGLTDDAYENKKRVIQRAIEINQPNKEDAVDVLAKVGGLDIAGLVGCYLGAAYYRVPIVIDGFISCAAALTAYQIQPLVKEYMIPSHSSAEPGFKKMMSALGLAPMLDMDMRLGEGTGAALAMPLVEAAAAVMNNMATFDEVTMEDDFLVDIR